jgi:hypothetical protein
MIFPKIVSRHLTKSCYCCLDEKYFSIILHIMTYPFYVYLNARFDYLLIWLAFTKASMVFPKIVSVLINQFLLSLSWWKVF